MKRKKLLPDPSYSLLSEEATTALLEQNPQAAHKNPMVRKFGFCREEGKQCASCIHLLVKRYANAYHKCALNQPERGEATDIRVRWDACGKYETRGEDNA